VPQPDGPVSTSPTEPLGDSKDGTGTAIIKVAEHKSMDKGDGDIKSQRASNNSQLPRLIVAAMAHLVYMMTEGEL